MVQYKDKKVFGVPLLLNVSQTGCALPQAILDAMRHLRKNGKLKFAVHKIGIYNPMMSRTWFKRNISENSLPFSSVNPKGTHWNQSRYNDGMK